MNPKQLIGSLSSVDSMIGAVLGLISNIGRQMQDSTDPNVREAQTALAQAREQIGELRSKISEVGAHLSKTASKGGNNVSKKVIAADDVKDIAKTLVDVADALDEKGAFEEAALADSLLQEIPEVFTVEETAPVEAPKAEAPKVEAPKVETPKAEAPATEAPKAEAPKAEAPKAEAPKTEGTPFSQLKDEKKPEEKKPEEKKPEEKKETPVNPEIKETKETPEVDEVSLSDFQDIINSMKLRISQGPKRKVYEQVLERARKAEEYKKAYEEWLSHAHKLLDEHKEPIRIKL